MRRLLFVGLAMMLTMAMALPALAGNPHFVGKTTIERDGNSLTVSGKIAGLGNEEQVDVQITVQAQCVNPGGNEPKADNKDELSAAETFPVQNGKALFQLTVVPEFQPDCTPPMTVVFTDLLVEDVTHDISRFFPGPF